jgi:uncharacterized protein (DUF1330 family)
MSDDRIYAVLLVWVRDPERFAEYQERARPILAKHGVHIERWLMTQDMDGDGLERPDEIVVTWFRTPEAKAAFENDAEFAEAVKIRDEAVKLVAITGSSVFGDPPPN